MGTSDAGTRFSGVFHCGRVPIRGPILCKRDGSFQLLLCRLLVLRDQVVLPFCPCCSRDGGRVKAGEG